MKIKTKKQLNLPQLIEWAMENDVTNAWHRASNVEEYISEVFFDATGLPRFSNTVNNNDTFTVEVEEEITEDTRLDKLVVRYSNDDIYIFTQERINDFKNDSSIIAFYIPNNDLTMTLIWRDGEMVE